MFRSGLYIRAGTYFWSFQWLWQQSQKLPTNLAYDRDQPPRRQQDPRYALGISPLMPNCITDQHSEKRELGRSQYFSVFSHAPLWKIAMRAFPAKETANK